MNSPSVKWLLEVKEKSQSGKKEEKLELTRTRRVESGTTTTYASVVGFLASADPQQ